MGAKGAAMTGPSNTRDADWHANEICSAWEETWRETVPGIFKTGVRLETAKEELGTRPFNKMIRDKVFPRIKLGMTSVNRLIAIAKDDKLHNEAHGLHFPPSWRTLYQLTRLTPVEFDKGIESGAINAGMARADVAKLRPPKVKPTPPEKPTGAISPQSACLATVRRLMFDTVKKLSPDELEAFFAEMREEVDDLESKAKEKAS